MAEFSLLPADAPQGDSSDSSAIAAELADLRRRIEDLRALFVPAIQARLWPLQETIWLGQNATLLVQLNDAGGRALIDQPVTVVTSWGELTASNAINSIWNNTAAARTNDAGMVELRLRARFQAPLNAAQRLALELAVGGVPMAAPWPTAASKEARRSCCTLSRAGQQRSTRGSRCRLSRICRQCRPGAEPRPGARTMVEPGGQYRLFRAR